MQSNAIYERARALLQQTRWNDNRLPALEHAVRLHRQAADLFTQAGAHQDAYEALQAAAKGLSAKADNWLLPPVEDTRRVRVWISELQLEASEAARRAGDPESMYYSFRAYSTTLAYLGDIEGYERAMAQIAQWNIDGIRPPSSPPRQGKPNGYDEGAGGFESSQWAVQYLVAAGDIEEAMRVVRRHGSSTGGPHPEHLKTIVALGIYTSRSGTNNSIDPHQHALYARRANQWEAFQRTLAGTSVNPPWEQLWQAEVATWPAPRTSYATVSLPLPPADVYVIEEQCSGETEGADSPKPLRLANALIESATWESDRLHVLGDNVGRYRRAAEHFAEGGFHKRARRALELAAVEIGNKIGGRLLSPSEAREAAAWVASLRRLSSEIAQNAGDRLEEYMQYKSYHLSLARTGDIAAHEESAAKLALWNIHGVDPQAGNPTYYTSKPEKMDVEGYGGPAAAEWSIHYLVEAADVKGALRAVRKYTAQGLNIAEIRERALQDVARYQEAADEARGSIERIFYERQVAKWKAFSDAFPETSGEDSLRQLEFRHYEAIGTGDIPYAAQRAADDFNCLEPSQQQAVLQTIQNNIDRYTELSWSSASNPYLHRIYHTLAVQYGDFRGTLEKELTARSRQGFDHRVGHLECQTNLLNPRFLRILGASPK